MHLLYLPNESNEGDQYGPRRALAKLKTEGMVDKVTIFSYRVIQKKTGNWKKTLNKLIRLIETERPTSILTQHIGKRLFSEDFFHSVINFYPNKPPVMAYDERDVYGYYRKPLPVAVKKFSKVCDVVFLVARGCFTERFRRFGCKNVCYLSNVSTFSTFGKPWKPPMQRIYDVIMIGNNTKSRLPFKSMPGSLQREKLAYKLTEKFGEKFALYGKGWERIKSNLGPLPFLDQEKEMRKAWIRVGYDHFPSFDGYYSNSLPITLFSGTAYVTKKISGMEDLLVDGYHCRFFDSPKEAIEIVNELLARPKDELINMGQRGAQLAQTMMNEDVRMERLISILKMYEATSTRKLGEI